MTQNDNNLLEMKRVAETQKELGNKYFKNGKIDESIKCYSEAIKLFSNNPIFYCNRSIAYLKKGLPLEAENDCNFALNIDKNCIKALYRRGLARKCLFRYQLAAKDFKEVLNLEPNNKESKRELQSIEAMIDSKTIVDIKPIHKELEFQSNKPLIRVPIIEKNSVELCEIESKLPEKVAKTYYQFECDWRQLIGDNNRHLRLKYMEMIGSDDFKTLLTSPLEPQMMSELIDTIRDSNDLNFIYCVLKQISKTPRFGTIVLLLSDNEYKTLNIIIEKMSGNNFDQNLIEDIKRNFFI